MSDHSSLSDPRWNLAAAVAGWAVPGLGHWLLGERTRGMILAVSIGTLWLSGILLGGLAVIDWAGHPWWFALQTLLGPSLLVDRLIQVMELTDLEPSLGRVNEQGVLYTALAGLLNLLALIDVMYRDPRKRARKTDDDGDPKARPAEEHSV